MSTSKLHAWHVWISLQEPQPVGHCLSLACVLCMCHGHWMRAYLLVEDETVEGGSTLGMHVILLHLCLALYGWASARAVVA